MAKSPKLVARVHLSGGVASKDKDTKAEVYHARAGTEITADVQKKLGLSDEDVKRMVARGHIVERADYVPPAAPGQAAPGTTGTAFEGMTIDDMHAVLDEAGVEYPEGASPQDLMKIALEHQAEPPAGDTGTGGAVPNAAAKAAEA